MDLIQQLVNEYGVPGVAVMLGAVLLAVELLVNHYKPTTRKN